MVKVLIKILSSLLLCFLPVSVLAANLSVSPAGGAFQVGDKVTLRIVATGDIPFNAVSGDVLFPPSLFVIESVSKTSSVLNFWVTEPTFLKSIGSVRFEGVALGGFQGTTGTAVTVNLRAIAAGSGKVSFRAGQILANDGEGTDITGDLVGATFSVKEAPAREVQIPAKQVPEPVLEPEVLQPKPSLEAPEIMRATRYGDYEILGTSNYPKAEVLVTFLSDDGGKVFVTTVADGDGRFNIVVPSSLKRGSYTVTAVIVKEDKTNSKTSNTVIIQIGNIFSDIGIEIWLLISLLGFAVLYLLIRIYFHFKKDGSIHKIIKHEAANAERVIHKSFDILREDVSSYADERLNVTERKMVSGIKKDINEAEKAIDKEIKDIESL